MMDSCICLRQKHSPLRGALAGVLIAMQSVEHEQFAS